MDLNKEREAFEASGICTKSMFDNVMWDQWQFKYVPLVREKKICDNAIKINDRFLGWKAAKSQAVPDGFVLVRTKNVKYFSNDGENYEIHDSLEDAKKEAESAIEWFSEQLADQQLDPSSDGNFHQVGYGVILAESSYSIDHIVTQEDIDKGEYSYEVGTQIMSLSLIEASQEPAHD